MTITYRDELTRDLTPAEVDANFRHVLDSANQSYTASGTGASTTTVQAQLRKFCFLTDYDTEANFNTAVSALTDTMGVRSLSYRSAAATDTRRLFTWTPATSGRGPFVMEGYEADFSGTRDPSLGWGYNAGANGIPIVTGEHAMVWNMEGNYNDGSGANKLETYLHFVHSNGTTTCRPVFIQMNRTTGKVAGLYLKSDTVTIKADDGTAAEGGADSYTFGKSLLTMGGTDTSADTTIRVNAASSHGAVLSLGYNAVTDRLRLISEAATSGYIEQGGRRILSFWSTPNGGAGEAISVGVLDNTAVGVFDSVNGANSVASLIARAKSSQTAVTFQVQDSGSNMVAGFNKDGALWLKDGITAPSATAGFAKIFVDTADGDLKIIYGDGTTKLIVADT